MLISVVTAVSNRETTIEQALESVLAQRGVELEAVVQDGESTDTTLKRIEGLRDPRVALKSEADRGIYDAINKGITRTSGDVVGLLHSDDYMTDDRVLMRVARALEDPDIDGVYGDLDYVSASEPNRVIRRWRSGAYHPDLLAKGWMPPHPTLYLRRRVFDAWGLYDTDFRIAADYEAILRYLVKGEIRLAYIPEVMVKMRVGGASNRSLKHILRKSGEDYRAVRRHGVGGFGTLLGKNFGKLGQFVTKASSPA